MTDNDEQEQELDWRDAIWPEPREDPPEEPSHHAARVSDLELGLERGDRLEEGEDGARA
jgi:hypothetical protein